MNFGKLTEGADGLYGLYGADGLCDAEFCLLSVVKPIPRLPGFPNRKMVNIKNIILYIIKKRVKIDVR